VCYRQEGERCERKKFRGVWRIGAISVALHHINKPGLLSHMDLRSHPNHMHQSFFLNPDYETAKISRNIGEF